MSKEFDALFMMKLGNWFSCLQLKMSWAANGSFILNKTWINLDGFDHKTLLIYTNRVSNQGFCFKQMTKESKNTQKAPQNLASLDYDSPMKGA